VDGENRDAGYRASFRCFSLFGLWPLTWSGCSVLLFSVLCLWVAASGHSAAITVRRFFPWYSDLAIRVLSIALLAYVSLSLLGVVVVAINVWRRVLVAGAYMKPSKVLCEERSTTGFTVGWSDYIPFIHISIEWPEVPDCFVEFEKGVEAITPTSRALVEELQRRFHVTGLLGLVSISFDHSATLKTPLQINPAKSTPVQPLSSSQTMSSGEMLSSEGHADGDRLEMRQYHQGDALRFVLWKIVARTGGQEKYVRTPEIVGEPRFAIFFAAEKKYDTASAELLQYILKSGALGSNWTFGISTAKETVNCPDIDRVLQLLAVSGSLPGDGNGRKRLETFLEEMQRNQCTRCVVLFPDTEALSKWVISDPVIECFGLVGTTADPDEEHQYKLPSSISVVEMRRGT